MGTVSLFSVVDVYKRQVYNRPVIPAKDDIAVFPHQLYYQFFPADIPHLIQMLYLQLDNAFQAGLSDADNLAVSYVFSQQHAEIRRRQRAGFVIFRKICQRQASAGAD